MSMYNLLEFSDNYYMASRSLWSYYTNEVNNNANENSADNYRSTPNDINILYTEVVSQLKYLSGFWRTLHLLLIKSETELNLKWKKYCLISEIYKTPEVCANPNANLPYPLIQVPTTTAVTFQINSAKLYVPVVTLCL